MWQPRGVNGGRRLQFGQTFPEFVRTYVGVELPVTVSMVQYTLTVMARFHVEVDPPPIDVFFCIGTLVTVRLLILLIPLWGPDGNVLWRGIRWLQNRGPFQGDEEQMGSVRVRPHVAAGTPHRVHFRHAFDRGDSHLLTVGGRKWCGGVYVFMSELLSCIYEFFSELFFSVGTIGRAGRRRFRGGSRRALPDAG